LPGDRSKILAWRIEQALACNECGTRLEEWEEDHNAYHVEATRCVGCEKIAWEQQAWSEERTSAFGIKFRLQKANQS